MNEKQAAGKGYSFTGTYSFDKEEVKEAAKLIRTAGYKAITVTVPFSKLSRGGGGEGYSVYAERRYFTDRMIERCKNSLAGIASRLSRAKEDYKEAVSEINTDEESLRQRLEELKRR